MSIQNADFNDAGEELGTADGWTSGCTVTGLALALLGSSTGLPGFEPFTAGWDNDDWSDVLTSPTACTFLPHPQREDEGFELGWCVDWRAYLASVEYAEFGPEPAGPVEPFEGGWQNDTWADSFAPAATEQVGFGDEGFSTGWGADAWSAEFEPQDLVAAEFDSETPEPVEDFEEEWN